MNIKYGQVNPETGLVYIGKSKSCKDGMRWCTPEKYIERRKAIESWRLKEDVREKKKKSLNTDENRAKRNEYAKIWRKNPEFKAKAAAYAREKRSRDYLHCLRERVRARICEAIREGGYGKRSKTTDLIGCDWLVLKTHIESKFVDGMNWSNRNLWHVDHIIPLSSAKSEDDLFVLFNYKNLQPLWAFDNRRKGAKLQEIETQKDDWR